MADTNLTSALEGLTNTSKRLTGALDAITQTLPGLSDVLVKLGATVPVYLDKPIQGSNVLGWDQIDGVWDFVVKAGDGALTALKVAPLVLRLLAVGQLGALVAAIGKQLDTVISTVEGGAEALRTFLSQSH